MMVSAVTVDLPGALDENLAEPVKCYYCFERCCSGERFARLAGWQVKGVYRYRNPLCPSRRLYCTGQMS